MSRLTTDFLVIGGGIVGLTTALELKRRHADARVLVLEKEARCGQHSSGRNSGVLHAGFYYTADSWKARLTRDGCAQLTAYCLEKGLRLRRCGKLVVARGEEDLPGLERLLERGRTNGVTVELISAGEARRIEPRARTVEKALWSPTTASADPVEVTNSFRRDAQSAGVRILSSTAFERAKGRRILTSRGALEAGYVVNAAGLYADQVARQFGFSRSYTILPFKGIYLYSSEAPEALKTNIYPVPNLRHPFLGVHFTVTCEGRHKIGPTAIPAFWRENYGGLANFSWREMLEIVSLEASLFFRAGFDFRGLALQEMRKYWRRSMIGQAAELVRGVRAENYTRWGRPGIRAQLIDLRTRRLVMDFCFEGDERSFHILNAVSPAWTCALPFSKVVCDEIGKRLG